MSLPFRFSSDAQSFWRRSGSRSASRHSYRLRFDELEDRLTPAATSFSGGVLAIHFAAAGEAITVTNSAGGIVLSGATFTGAGAGVFAGVNRIEVTDTGNHGGQSLTIAGTPFVLSGGINVAGAETLIVDAAIMTSGAAVTLEAMGDITLNNSISSSGGAIDLHADSDANGVGGLTLSAASFTAYTQQQVAATGGANDDNFGTSVAVSSDGNTAIVGAPADDIGGNESQGSATIFVRSGGVWTQQQQLIAAGGAAVDGFGFSVALSSDGNTAIVGALFDDVGGNINQGTATIFVRSGSIWTQQQQFTAAGGAAFDNFGNSVALSGDGNTAIVGAYLDDVGANGNQGTATIFVRSGGIWIQQQQLTDAGGESDDGFGYSVALSGDGNTAIVGAQLDDIGGIDFQGTATIFSRSGGVWTQQQQFTAAGGAAGVYFGRSVALSSDGKTAVVGAVFGGNENQGMATIFTRTGSNGGAVLAGAGAVSLRAGSVNGIQPIHANVDISAATTTFVSGSDLRFTVDGSAPDSGHTQLHVAGPIDLAGANLVVLGSHIPMPGEVITLVSASDVVGTFNGRLNNSFIVVNGFQYRINYTATAVTLTAQVSTSDVFINAAWNNTPLGTVFADADPTTPGNQSATFGITAFAGAEGLESVGEGKTATVFAGVYPQAASLALRAHVRIPSGTATFSGVLSGTGGLSKVGSGTLVLSAANLFTGGVNVSQGKLQISNDANLGAAVNPVNLAGTGELFLAGNATTSRHFDLSTGTLTINASQTLTFAGGSILGGVVRGPGTITTTLGQSASFVDSTFRNSLAVAANGTDLFEDIVNAGVINVAPGQHTVSFRGSLLNQATGRIITGAGSNTKFGDVVSFGQLTFSGSVQNLGTGVVSLQASSIATVSAGGSLDVSEPFARIDVADGAVFNVAGTASVAGLVSHGQINVANGGSLVGVGPEGLNFAGGSITIISAGGNIDIGAERALVTDAFVKNFGTFGSTSTDAIVDFGGLVTGPGIFYSIVTQNGGIYSPGSSPGPAGHARFEINGGGVFGFEISNAAGAAGNVSGWDVATVAPNLFRPTSAEILLTATPASKYTIAITSLLDDGVGKTAGAAANFNPGLNYAWKFLDGSHAATTVTGTFDPAAFNIVTAGFQNAFTGTFSVELRDAGKNLYLVYTAQAQAPTITGIAPFSGPTTGGTTVVITGTGFVVGQTSVTIGPNPATNVSVNPAGTQITATTPAAVNVGTVEVVVTTPAGSSSTVGTANDFTYTAAAPTLQTFEVNGGEMWTVNSYGEKPTGLAGNNSIVEQLYVEFDIGVTIGAGAFTIDAGTVTQDIVPVGGVAPVAAGTNVVAVIVEPDASTLDSNGGFKGYRLRFSGSANYLNTFDNGPSGTGGVGNLSTTLKDGFYKLNINGSAIHAGNTLAGTPMSGMATEAFWVMYASYAPDDRDVAGEGHPGTPGDGTSIISVNASLVDFARTNGFGYGTSLTGPSGQAYNANFDWNLDGDVGDDLIEFAKRFGAEWSF